MNLKKQLALICYRRNIPIDIFHFIWVNYFAGCGAVNLTFFTEEYKEKIYNKNFEWNYIPDQNSDYIPTLKISDGIKNEMYLHKFYYLDIMNNRRESANKLITMQMDFDLQVGSDDY